MVDDVATSVGTASARAWIHTLVPNASFISATFGAEYAFRSTGFVRVPNELGQTSADTVVALCVRTAR